MDNPLGAKKRIRQIHVDAQHDREDGRSSQNGEREILHRRAEPPERLYDDGDDHGLDAVTTHRERRAGR